MTQRPSPQTRYAAFERRVAPVLALLFVALLALIALHATLAQAGPAAEQGPFSDGEAELKGLVLAKPAASDGVGAWLIQGRRKGMFNVAVYTVTADSATQFEPRPDQIQISDTVKVQGVETGPFALQAKEIHKEDPAGAGDEVQGVVVARPGSVDGQGDWLFHLGPGQFLTVTADANTRFDKGLPQLNQWAEAKGAFQADGSLLATRIRPDDYEADNVVVRLKDGVDPNALVGRHGLTLIRSVLPSANIHLYSTVGMNDDEENVVNMLKTQDADIVIWAELNYTGGIPEGNPYDIWEWGGQDASGYINQQAFAQVHMPPSLAYTGRGITVALIDTGVALAHPALAGHLAAGWDMVDDDAIPNDEPGGAGWGHGTHIAGIIAHMAPESVILPVRVLTPQGRGNSFVVAYAIEWAVNQGAQVINLSLGTDFDSQILREAVAWAASQGVVVVAAAGNRATATPHYPAAYPNVVSVTAVDATNRKAVFASYGAGWVDVAAPGVGITSTIVGDQGYGYASWSGTSMSTAFVSAAAALERQQSPAASAAQVEGRIVASADDLDALNPVYAGQLGGGLLNVSRLLDIPETTATPTPTSTSTGTPTGTPTPTSTGTSTPTPTGTSTPTPTATGTPTGMSTPTPTATATPPETSTPTPTATGTPEVPTTPTPAMHLYLPQVRGG